MALGYHLSFPTGVFTSYSLLPSASLLFKENILNMHILGIPWWPSGIGAFSAEGPGSIPDWGTKIPQSTWTSNPLPQMHILSWSTASSLSCLSFVLGMVVTRVTAVSRFQGDAQPTPSLSIASHCYPKCWARFLLQAEHGHPGLKQ